MGHHGPAEIVPCVQFKKAKTWRVAQANWKPTEDVGNND